MNQPEVRTDLALAEGYHSPQVDVDVRLNTNESPVLPPAGWRDAIAAELTRIEWHRYPDRAAARLRSALAEHYEVDPSMVFAANGSNEVLQSLLLAFGGPGRTAAIFEPTYALHSHISKITGTPILVGQRGENFVLEKCEVDRILDCEPAVLFLCSPNNPTGLVDSESLLRYISDRVREQATLLVIDEAYGQFASWSALELVEDQNSVVVTRTFSKTWSMAAVRLGYVVAPTWVVDALESVTLPYHLDAVKQVAGRLALQFVDEMDERVSRLVEERDRMVAALSCMPVTLWPSGANFFLFRPELMSGQAVWDALVARGVLVRDCASWPKLQGCLRVTVGTPVENDTFLTLLGEILEE